MLLLEFPQNVIGYIVFVFYTRILNNSYYKYKDAYVTHVKGKWGGISLSRFIFVDDDCYQTEIIKHEYGHTLQSKKLLFLYLFVIGLPSLVWNRLFRSYRSKNKISYYSFYTESWANNLGGYSEK